MQQEKEKLVAIVRELRSSSKEGIYWDFKRKHHLHNHELLHDILCLANAEHEGDRYLIYGVENQSGH